MSPPDLNLLITLNVVLEERSVARAAKRLHLSPSATSRALARIRKATCDPLLVRAGRGLVPTPRAIELRERVRQLVEDAEAVLRPAETLDLRTLTRTFTIRTREGFIENFGPDLIARISDEAPGVQLRFIQKTDKESTSLRDGTVDLETGVVGAGISPEICTLTLFRDSFVGVVRLGHQFTKGRITPSRYARGRHIGISRRGRPGGPIEDSLMQLGLERVIVTSVSSFSTALALCQASDLTATVPERHTGNLRAGMFSFALPFPVPDITVSMLWHPRMDSDPAHTWLRHLVLETVQHAIRLK